MVKKLQAPTPCVYTPHHRLGRCLGSHKGGVSLVNCLKLSFKHAGSRLSRLHRRIASGHPSHAVGQSPAPAFRTKQRPVPCHQAAAAASQGLGLAKPSKGAAGLALVSTTSVIPPMGKRCDVLVVSTVSTGQQTEASNPVKSQARGHSKEAFEILNHACLPNPYLKNTCPRKSRCRTSRMADQWTSSWLLQTDLVWRAV